MEITLETAADGSLTLFREDIDEHYHSVKGAVAESAHVYVDLGWRVRAAEGKALRVFEVGFGTGLNAALTAMAAEEQRVPTHYFSAELYPLPQRMATAYADAQPEIRRIAIIAVNAARWNEPVEINEFFTIEKMNADFLAMDLPEEIDVVYFDAFSPEKQPEMWSSTLFRKIYDAMSAGAVLTTYCAKGSIRRMLSDIGFVVERMPGPDNGKREVLRARKPHQRVRPS